MHLHCLKNNAVRNVLQLHWITGCLLKSEIINQKSVFQCILSNHNPKSRFGGQKLSKLSLPGYPWTAELLIFVGWWLELSWAELTQFRALLLKETSLTILAVFIGGVRKSLIRTRIHLCIPVLFGSAYRLRGRSAEWFQIFHTPYCVSGSLE